MENIVGYGNAYVLLHVYNIWLWVENLFASKYPKK